MKLSTRQYAKKQVKWVKQKLVPAARATSSGDVYVFLLDATRAFPSQLPFLSLYLKANNRLLYVTARSIHLE